MNKIFFLILILIAITSCSEPIARKPVVRKTSSFMTESIQRNKVLNKMEEAILQQIVKKDTLHEYLNSEYGFWYFYKKKQTGNNAFPKAGDEVFFTYEVKNVQDSILYSKEEIGVKQYKIDKQEMITGLQEGIKLMKESEIVTFLFPSHKAFGYTGLEKINTNQPLIYTVELKKIITNNTINENN